MDVAQKDHCHRTVASFLHFAWLEHPSSLGVCFFFVSR